MTDNSTNNSPDAVSMEAPWPILPRPCLPPSNEFVPVEKFVCDAIASRSTTNSTETTTTTMAASADHRKGYRHILELLRKPKLENVPMITKVFLAFCTMSGQGHKTTVHLAGSERRSHSQLLHEIFKFNPFFHDPTVTTNCNITTNTPEKKRKQEYRTSKEMKEVNNGNDHVDAVVVDFSLTDAYLNLIVTLVSANSVFLLPALRSIWRLLNTPDMEPVIVVPPFSRVGDENADDADYDFDALGNIQSSIMVSEVGNLSCFTSFMNHHDQRNRDDGRKKDESDATVPKDISDDDDEATALTTSTKEASKDTTKNTDNQNNNDEEEEDKEQKIRSLINQQAKNSRLHATLKKIIVQLVPMKGPSAFVSTLKSSFPYKTLPLPWTLTYVQQCFLALTYVPSLQHSLIHFYLDRCLEIDVEIFISDDGLVKLIKDVKGEGGEKKDEEDQEDGKNVSEEVVRDNKRVEEMAEKLDFLMLLLFQHLQSSASSSKKDNLFPKPPKSTIRELYEIIMSSFRSIILTTHRSKFVQFAVFFLCGLDNDGNGENGLSINQKQPSNEPPRSKLYWEFAMRLLQIIVDSDNSTVIRQSATCYLASFISRASYVCTETACECIQALLRFAEAYMDKYPTEASARRKWKDDFSAGSQRRTSVGATQRLIQMHALFYTVCQAMFYIMVFRGKECIYHMRKVSSQNSKIQYENIVDEQINSNLKNIDASTKRWTRLCSYHLQPLRNCLESVRGEFILLSNTFGLIEDNVLNKLIMEDRKMSSLSKSPSLSRKDSARRSRMKRLPSSRIRTPATVERKRQNGVGGLGKGKNPLASFFPFDPYLLQRSNAYVEPYYQQWKGGCSYDDQEEEEKAKNISSMFEVEDMNSSLVLDDTTTTTTTTTNALEEIETEIDNDDIGSSQDTNDDMSHEDENSDCSTFPPYFSMIDSNNNDVETYQSDNNKKRKYSMTISSEEEEDSNSNVIPGDASVHRESWMQELKRARALSMTDECW